MKWNAICFFVLVAFGVHPICLTQTPITTELLTADYEVTEERILIDGNKLQRCQDYKWFRDGAGRTRLEQGPFVTITDPTTKQIFLVDPRGKVARRLTMPSHSDTGSRVDATTQLNLPPGLSPPTEMPLGIQVLEGYETVGTQFTTSIPAGSRLGNSQPLVRTLQLWRSAQLRLPLLMIVEDPLIGKKTVRYKNIRVGSHLSDTLFQVPANYRIVEVERATR